MPTPLILLASASPRRSALLHQLGLAHKIQPVDLDENHLPGEAPADYVRRLSLAKAQAAHGYDPCLNRSITLGADTCVSLEQEIFGKPADEEDCLRILQRLSGRTHRVHTAVSACSGDLARTVLSVSEVEFRPLTTAECRAYWRCGEPRDKAGAYAIQGRAALFVQRIQGSYSGIMGLPLFETAQLLCASGIDSTVLLQGSQA